ncbi:MULTISPECIES: acyl-CoA dehydrogenase family protein [Nocardiaceae]|jgi:acyl-CoA dehydrogenase|uniref:acyl-CoA dehydrogenase family protein n=1 Tax=Nocardiaceae TaxID=85025 RepID=UPI00050C0EAD|nr:MULTISPECIES: acyl-CoA dehydrogenase family protein [Rhodococcus]MDP9638391.1 acyl-CoA dehydrogenase [Rhodococcus cercidiphylli]MBJ7321291.1 acyl-CoA dehydrogenase family protein [Rhodococcus sp. (in: high G+C Gram-positive bacteria)]MCX6490540.1 acyl-CoA dehydrogenase family protein [Rhodococcus sp. (in: high G+C Gram-positive bacteria)]MDQ0280287.1 acyl-CoA dehydrogenase [Rhodococcus fascians]OZD06236.1 acyl-CoA dehydrogenase [Rhodococcus sp. 06-221-2]
MTALADRTDDVTTELADVRQLARSFFEKEVAPHREEFATAGRPSREVYRSAGNHGLLGMSIPQQYGGGGGDFRHEAVLFEEQVRAGDSAMQLGVHSGIVPHYILAYATEEKKQRWLPKLCSGEWIGAIAMTEPGTGSDLQGITTRAVRDGDEYVVTGGKTFISNGAHCDLIIIAAKTDPTAGARGLSLLVAEVSDDTEGFHRGRVLHKIGQKGQDTAELSFDGLRVPAANLLGEEGRGFAQLMQQLPQERLICGIAAAAMIEAAVQQTVDYTKSRNAFGKTLFDLQNTKFELAECATIGRVVRTFVDDAVAQHISGSLDVTTAAMVKYWTTDRQFEVVDRCLQLFGGYGYMEEYPIARMFVDGRIARIYAGANEVMKDLISRSL